MLIYLYGADSYRRRQKLNSLIEQFEKKHSGFTVRQFDLDAESGGKEKFEELKNFVSAQPLFSAFKLAVIHNPADSQEIKDFLKEVSENKSTTVIVAADKKLPKELDSILKKAVIREEFKPLKGSELAAFLKKEAEKRKIKPTLELLDYLIKTSGGDIWGAVTELEKISLGAKPEKITQVPELFPLIQRIKSRNPLIYKLPALAYLLENEDPAKIFNITASVAEPELKKKMADYDVLIKSGKMDYEEALTDLVINWSSWAEAQRHFL